MAPRILLCCLAVLGLAGCGVEHEPSGSGREPSPTELTIRVDPDGRGPEPAGETRVSCDEPGQGKACAAAARLRPADLEPVPDDVACTELYGGPQTATIAGTLDRERVDARFSREDGCEIARWEKVAPLLEAAG
jgi:hypothetical protein